MSFSNLSPILQIGITIFFLSGLLFVQVKEKETIIKVGASVTALLNILSLGFLVESVLLAIFCVLIGMAIVIVVTYTICTKKSYVPTGIISILFATILSCRAVFFLP